MQIINDKLNIDVIKKYHNRIVGSLENNNIIITKSSSNATSIRLGTHGLNPIMLKCPRCKQETNPPAILLPGCCTLVDGQTGHIIEPDMKIESCYIYSITWCHACVSKYLLQHVAKLICNQCEKLVAWMEAGETSAGDTIIAGQEYHCPTCPHCATEKLDHLQILEFKPEQKGE